MQELLMLYEKAKEDDHVDLAFRILSRIGTLKPKELSLDMLSNDELITLMNQCENNP